MTMPEQKKAVVPRLRFPEFRDAGPWEVKRLGEIAEGLTSLSGKTAKDFGHGNAFYVPYINVYENAFVDINCLPEVNISDNETQNAVRYGDILFTVSSETPDEAGLSSVFLHDLENCYVNSFCTIYRPGSNVTLSPVFSGYYFRINLVREHFIRNAQGAIRFNLNREAFNQTPVLLPSPPEQQKIADCLSSLDELIELQAKKLEALQAHKKGLMQQLFPREGETTPRLRFSEFRDAGPWEIRTIEDVAEKIAQGGTPDTTVPEFWNGEIPWITPAEMGDDALHHYTKQTVRALSTIGLQNSSAEILPAYSVIVSSRAPIGYVTINTVPIATNQGCKGIVPKQQIYHEFLYYSLLRAKRQLNDLGAGAGFKEISASSLKKLKILMPERAEQQKIADCLSSLDELIELQAKKLEALQAHKKGLMQQLFPQEVG